MTATAASASASDTVGVRFRRAGRIYYFRAAGLEDLGVNEHVVVDTSRGRELGWVVIAPTQLVDSGPEDLKPVTRRASDEDLAALADRRSREPSALATVRERIREHNLPMKAVLTEYSFDGSQLTVYFVSDETRVDFRTLVRDLARDLRTRVHLRQIGPRDQAKLLGGIDRCGRELCCSTWMPEFQPIAIRMAKNQNLPLSPTEISGVCGKLLCCLAFEDEQYAEMRQGMPKLGAKLTSAVGRGKVVDVNVLTRKITIIWETGGRVEVSAEEFAEQQERRKRAQESGQEIPTE
jgi:cell fate regulator YaaT (PSP1 superfamily)